MKRRELLALLPAPLLAQRAGGAAADPVLKAMMDEMARAKSLGIAGGQPIYYMECVLDDVRQFSAVGSLGGLMSARTTAFRIPKVAMRIGDKKFDNTNYVLSDVFFGTRFDGDGFPLDNNPFAMRQTWWLALDRAYKTAIEAIGRKKAALRNITQPEELADFTDAPMVKLLEPVPNFVVDEEAMKNRVRQLSGIFAAYPKVLASSVELELSNDTQYYLNSDGAETRTTELMSYLRIRAQGQAADGMRVRDHDTVLAFQMNEWPAQAEIEKKIQQVGKNVEALVAAPVGESYSGPVLFEGEAAAELFADMIGSQATVQRKPVAEPGRPVPIQPGELEGRVGSKILPSGYTVVDDPTQKEYKGRKLMGHYAVDQEGVAPKPVVLAENGTWKGFLSTRTPTRETKESNGHGRLPGSFGAASAFMSNLFVKAEQTVPAEQLKKKLLELIQQRNKPYGLLIRKLDFPSTASIDELRQMFNGAGGRPAALPLLAYKVFPDGREELVRGLRFRGLNVKALRDIVAASTEETHLDFIGNPAPFSLVGGGNYVVCASVVAPSVLFEDLELEKPQLELPKLPVVPAPTLTA